MECDVRKTDQEIEKRMGNVLIGKDNLVDTKYAREQLQIRQCRENMEAVKKDMLMDDLKKSVRRLKQLGDAESAVQDAAKEKRTIMILSCW